LPKFSEIIIFFELDRDEQTGRCEICDQNSPAYRCERKLPEAPTVRTCYTCSGFLASHIVRPIAISRDDAIAWLRRNDDQSLTAYMLGQHLDFDGMYRLRKPENVTLDTGFYQFSIYQKEGTQ
jgi:hypothetical protein